MVQCAHNNQRVVHVNELSSGNYTFTGHSGENGSMCCVYGNCTCNSLDHALANLTSNVLINITTDMTLSSLIKLSDLENVSVIGHNNPSNNPTVNCKTVGGVHFTSCHNCIIQGITWNECGTEDINNYTEPGLALSYSTNIIINNCLFQYSKGPAVLLSAVSGNVNISNCSFTHNSQYRGHGAAIHYSLSNLVNCLQLSFLISDCNFTYNKHAESLVYIENRISEYNNNIVFHGLKFCHNQGSSVYAISQNIYFNKKILFQNNTAEDGTAVYITDYSTVIFGENSEVTCIQNIANFGNGIVFLRNYSNVIFDQNSVATFDGNKVSNGIVNSEINSNITFQANCKVTFHSNSARCYGAAICSSNRSHVIFTGNANVTFDSNVVSDNYEIVHQHCGGTIHLNYYSYVSFEGNSTTVFTNNTVDYGGAINFGNSFITFKDSSSTMFDNNTAGTNGGAISCEYANRYIFYSLYCYIFFEENSTTTFSNNIAYFGGAVYMSSNIGKLSFDNFSTTIFSHNIAEWYGGAIYSSTSISFKANATIEFSDNIARYGGAVHCDSVSFKGSSATKFINNTARDDGGAIYSYFDIVFSDNCTVKFTNNNAMDGASVYSHSKVMALENSSILFNDHLVKWCNNTCLPYRGKRGYWYIIWDVIIIDSNGVVWCSNQKAFICSNINCYCKSLEHLLDGLTDNTIVNITDNVKLLTSSVVLSNLENISIIGHNNITVICGVDGGGLHLRFCNKIIVEGFTWIGCGISNIYNYKPVIEIDYSSGITIQNCTFQYSTEEVIVISHIHEDVNINHCNFKNNDHYRNHGACIYCGYSYNTSTININNCNFSDNGDSKSIVYLSCFRTSIYLNNSNFQKNKGTSMYLLGYNFILHINGEVLFDSNVAENGAGIYVDDNCTIIFDRNSDIKFVNNSVTNSGAAIFLDSYSSIIFDHTSAVIFTDNKATNGTIYCSHSSNVIFKASCQVTFSENSATKFGSTIFSDDSYTTFSGNSKVTFSNNAVSSNDIDIHFGGTIFSKSFSYITFDENSSVVFNHNIANFGAAILSFSYSSITFTGGSKVIFNNNIARYCGVLTSDSSCIIFNDNTEVTFNSNTVSYTLTDSAAAAAICASQKANIMFSGYSLVKFTNNTAGGGGAMVFSDSNVIIEEYSTVIFNNNIAKYSYGAAFTCYSSSDVTFRGYSNASFINNKASQDGGAVYSYSMCNITTTDNSTITFLNNTARNNGGAVFNSDISSITMTGNSVLSFINNEASHGGAICISEKSKLMIQENSIAVLSKNSAIVSGGALKVLSNSSITLNDNVTVQLNDNSADYGGAIFLDTTAVMVNSSNNIKFTDNVAKIFGSSIYQDIAELCNSSCVHHKVVSISNEHIVTPPNELKFNDPAICIDNDNDTQCNRYIIRNIMLGREIVIPACVLDYYNQSIDSAQFLIHGEINPSYFISGPKHVIISNKFEGITIMANQTILKTSTNFLISIALNTALYSNWKQISVNLTIELSPCPPGFWQYPESDKCECYNYNDANEDTVFCSGSSSTIKGGYWFGSVTGKPTVTICPINFCNFTCCETSNGYYHLSPVRDNQCRSHRSGTACGSCTDGYTLTFDSTECVNINNCTAGHTVLVILLSIIYWIVMVTSVFAIMYYKVGIGYLYGITYYYSIVDILLSQNLHVNRGLHLTVSMMSSFSKITPRFLGDLCFTKAMSGIDQQFIHYMHPSAVVLILVVISLSARFSQRVSLFISRGIIHVICLLLLLSYTSIASTSLLLMRSLTFHGIDKVYTYLSPDIEYFHGRHAAYSIVALLCIISIVTGLPLLLTLEPFINHKFNFTKIKPLLDQFQGCYKDKYRCFAGYYMICRLVIISIVIAKSADDFVANYILIVVCVITELIHAMVKPYNKELLNKLDTIILRLIILITALSLSDDFESPFVITIAVILVISPLLILIAITLFLHKHNLRKMIKRIECFAFKDEAPNKNDVNKNEMPLGEYNLLVDDNMRENNTIFDV